MYGRAGVAASGPLVIVVDLNSISESVRSTEVASLEPTVTSSCAARACLPIIGTLSGEKGVAIASEQIITSAHLTVAFELLVAAMSDTNDITAYESMVAVAGSTIVCKPIITISESTVTSSYEP